MVEDTTGRVHKNLATFETAQWMLLALMLSVGLVVAMEIIINRAVELVVVMEINK